MPNDIPKLEVDPKKKFFENQFLPSNEDRLLLSFFEEKAQQIFTRLQMSGYSKDAIADGVIFVMNNWRNRP